MPPISFRDPDGFVVAGPAAEPVFRITKTDAAERLLAWLASPTGRQSMEDGDFVRTAPASPKDRDQVLATNAADPGSVVLQHERVWFPTYPNEWTRGMLREAGLLTLRLAERLRAEGQGLKDATPWNVLFRGAKPIFIDALSLEPRDARDPLWRPLAQFFSTFVYPLWQDQWIGVGVHEAFAGRREGWTTREMYDRLSWLNRLRPQAFPWITLSQWMGSRTSATTYRSVQAQDAETAQYVTRRLFHRLRRTLEATPEALHSRTDWSSYQTDCHYDRDAQEAKRVFVAEALLHARRVLDLGANSGEYSFLAAEQGAAVIAVEGDRQAANEIWRYAHRARLNVLPLVMNLARPTPSTGWRNREQISFVERAAGQFDAVLMLALLHHLTVTERVPLPAVLHLAADLTRRTLVIEYISPQDPFYRCLLRGRDALHAGDTRESFEAELSRRFLIRRAQPILDGRRCLYWCEKRAGV